MNEHIHDGSCAFGNPTCPEYASPVKDYTVYYSVEWTPKDNTYNCWNQHSLTRSRLLARLYLLEAILSNRKSRFRIREV